jgi:hypothetical protein
MSSKQEISGRLGKFMPQISCDENIEINNKTCEKELTKNKKQKNPCDTCAMRHARDTHWSSNAENHLTPSRATTKHARAATKTLKPKITILILIKN